MTDRGTKTNLEVWGSPVTKVHHFSKSMAVSALFLSHGMQTMQFFLTYEHMHRLIYKDPLRLLNILHCYAGQELCFYFPNLTSVFSDMKIRY